MGSFILGDESLNRFLAETPRPTRRDDYPELARASLSWQIGSSAGGDQPKFATTSEGRHVLVKFTGHEEGAAARRWSDLLVCESFALEAVQQAGLQSASTRPLLIGGYRFLEVDRFDRFDARGRRTLVSLREIEFRERCAHCRDAVEELTSRVPGGL